MNEINKPNDILVSTLVNGNVDIPDLLSNGITADNTQLLDPEFYKKTNIVKKAFSDEKGNFDNDKFLQAYENAARTYTELTNIKTYQNLEKYVEYNQNDIFAPLDSKKAKVSYEITPEINPMRKSHGVTSLFDYGASTKSMRELAQQSKIWDSENEKWLDHTAEDRGILGSLFGESLVYATWDEDGVHEDLLTGRQIKHKKGDWKLNDKGQYYTETIGNRSSRGKQFVAASDTLTKEDSALNKIDFFDSDDLEKSVVGNTFKAVAAIAPYIFPGTQMIWGGITAAIAMNKALPAFAKMMEGIATRGDAENETAFTRAMNKWENYFSKFEDSYSDKDNTSNWSYGKITNIVSDVFGQLYQMRAAASLSKLVMRDPTKQALKKFEKEYLPQVINGAIKPGSGIELTNDELGKIALLAAQKSPEVQAAIKAQSALSKALSTGYMALTSTSDVYNEALNGGYDRRMAGLAGLTAAIGQYSIMRATSLGDWFLSKNVGYSEHANRQALLKAVRPYYDDIKKAVETLESAASQTEKQKIIGGLFNKVNNSIKKAWNTFEQEGSVYWRNAVTESIEEVTEEAVLDATKGVFDFLSWAGIGNPNASFGVAQDFTSGSFLERYIQSAFGGFIGGALFELQQKKIEPFMKEKLHGIKAESIQPSLVHEIANGNTKDLIQAIKDITKLDSEVSSISQEINGSTYATSANGSKTRGEVIADVLISYINTLEGAIIDENANLTDEQLVQKSIRDYQALKLLKQGGMDKLLISDFTKLSSEIASIKSELKKFGDKKDSDKTKESSQSDAKNPNKIEEYDDGIYSNKSQGFLEELLNKKREELAKFLNGDKGEFYLYKTLVGLTPEIRTALGNISIYDYTYLKYGKEFKDLPKNKGVLNKDLVQKEYEEWKTDTDLDRKFIKFGVEAYKDAESRFSDYAKKYIQENYGEIADVVFSKVLSPENLSLNALLSEDKDFQYIQQIADALKADSKDTQNSYAGDVTLQHIFKQDVLKLKGVISRILDVNDTFVQILQQTGKTKEQIIDGLSRQAQKILEEVSIDALHGTALSTIFWKYFQQSLSQVVDQALTESPNKTQGEVQEWLLQKGFIKSPFVDGDGLLVTDADVIKDNVLKLFTISIPQDANIGISTSVLQEYITQQDTVDGNISQMIQDYALKAVINKLLTVNPFSLFQYGTVEDMMEGMESYFDVSETDLKELRDQINGQFGSIDTVQLIESWASNLVQQKWQQISEQGVSLEELGVVSENEALNGVNMSEIDPNTISGILSKDIISLLESVQEYKLYQSIKNKRVKQNPIFESLQKIDLRLSESAPSKVLEILKSQHDKIRKAEFFGDYLPKGEEKIQLENAIRAIDLYDALLIGMGDGPVGFGNPFAVNQQMKRFMEKIGKSSSNTYDTLNEDSVQLMRKDLQILKYQIQGYLQIAERSYINKTKMDKAIAESYSKALIQTIQQKASAFTIDDISILPSDDELRKYQTPEDLLLCYAHSIYSKFQQQFKSPQEKQAAIKQLIQKLNLEKFNRSSKPSDLNREIAQINDYDLVAWLAAALGGDVYEFYYRYNTEFLNDGNSKLAPLFSQEQAAWQAWAFARDGYTIASADGRLITAHEAILQEMTDKDAAYVISPHTFFINGITGAGKTSAVSRIVGRLNSDKVLYITAANEGQQKKFIKAMSSGHPNRDYIQGGQVHEFLRKFITDDGMLKVHSHIEALRTKRLSEDYINNFTEWLFNARNLGKKGQDIFEVNKDFLKQLLKKDIKIEEIPELIFIDEATQVDVGVLKILNALAEEFGFKIILSGDTTQRGVSELGDPQAVKDLMGWTAAKLNISVRSLNNQKGNNNAAYNQMLEKYEQYATERQEEEFNKTWISNPQNHQQIAYYQDNTHFNGDKFVESLEQAKDDIKHIAQLNKQIKGKVIVITELDKNGNPTNESLQALLTSNGFEAGEYSFYSYQDTHAKAVQGAEADYVIVDGSYLSNIDITAEDAPKGELLRSVYTFASRSLRGSLMVLPIKYQMALNLSNRRDKLTQPDEIPELADLAKLKEERIKSLQVHLNGYTPEEIELAQLNLVEVEGTKVARRKLQEAAKSTSVLKPKTTSSKEVDPNEEDTFSEEHIQEINGALNNPINDNQCEGSNTIHSVGRTPFVGPPSATRPTRLYGAMDHLGVKEMESLPGHYTPSATGTGLDMDDLFDPSRYIKPRVVTGFKKFLDAFRTAANKDDVCRAIKYDDDIVAFLLEALPTVAKKNGLPDNTLSEDHNRVYSEWFRDNVEIDNNYYIFAKKLNWDKDKPTIANARLDQSVKEGNTVLYFGIKLRSNENPDAPLFNHYFSLGTLSDRTYKDAEGNIHTIESVDALYTRATQDVNNSQAADGFVAYRLPNTTMFNLELNSTLWIRKINNPDVTNVYSSVNKMMADGTHINTDDIYMVDSSTVMIDGKKEYAALVYAALVGSTSGDVNPKTGSPLTFKEKLENLKEVFIKDGELIISGSYMTFAQRGYLDGTDPIKSKAYRRLLFLSPKKYTIDDVLDSLVWKKEQPLNTWRSRLHKCRPWNQVEIIAEMLLQAHAFGFDSNGKSNIDTLYKFLIGLRQVLGKQSENKYNSDKQLVQELINWANETRRVNGTISKEEFLEKIRNSQHKPRILLFPFFTTFVKKEGLGYKIADISKEQIVQNNGIDQLKEIKVSRITPILLDTTVMPEGRACPPLTGQDSNKFNLIEEHNIPQEELSKHRLPEGLSLSFFKIADYKEIGEDLGMYDHELQLPVYSISNEELKVDRYQNIESPLRRADDSLRFTKRAVYFSEIPNKPEDFDSSKYHPEKLTENAFIIDPKYQQYVNEKEEPVYTKDKKGKRRRAFEWVKDKNGHKVKDKNGQYKRKYKTTGKKIFHGYTLIGESGKHFRITANNSMGFEVRLGDVVQLWGQSDRTFKVVGINAADSKNVKIRLGAAGNGDGDFLENFGQVKEVSIEAVTKVVKRTVSHKKYIEYDFYHKGKFDIRRKYAQEQYAQVEKTADTMMEMILAADEDPTSVPSLNFDKYWYFIKPIQQVGGDDEFSRLDSITEVNNQTGVVTSLLELLATHEDLEQKEAIGYSLFRISKNAYNLEKGKSFDAPRIAKDLQNMIDESNNPSDKTKQPSRSSIVQHHVFFREDIMNELLGRYRAANPATFYQHDEVAASLSDPRGIFKFKEDGSLDLKALQDYRAAYITIDAATFNNKSHNAYPTGEFIISPQKDINGNTIGYRLYPSPSFYFKTGKNGQYLYQVSEGKEGTDHRTFQEAMTLSTNPTDNLTKWNKLLTGLNVTDRIGVAWAQSKKEKNSQYSNQDIDNARLRMYEIPNANIALSGHIKYVISGVTQKENTLHVHFIVDGAPVGSENSFHIPLSNFLVFFGSRFILNDTSRSNIFTAKETPVTVQQVTLNIPQQEVAEVEEVIETDSEQVTPTVVSINAELDDIKNVIFKGGSDIFTSKTYATIWNELQNCKNGLEIREISVDKLTAVLSNATLYNILKHSKLKPEMKTLLFKHLMEELDIISIVGYLNNVADRAKMGDIDEQYLNELIQCK